MEILTVEGALIMAVTALSGVIGILWKKTEEGADECRKERAKCEELLRQVWEYAGRRSNRPTEPPPEILGK